MESFGVFIIVCMLLGGINFAFYTFNKNYLLKKRLHPFIMILSGVVFSAFLMANSAFDFVPLVFFLPVIGLITFLNITWIRFCPHCGSTIYKQNNNWWDKTKDTNKICPRCGEKLDK